MPSPFSMGHEAFGESRNPIVKVRFPNGFLRSIPQGANVAVLEINPDTQNTEIFCLLRDIGFLVAVFGGQSDFVVEAVMTIF